jgi:hypothetical protein
MQLVSLRTLNRTTLARQMLLERATLPVPHGIGRLVGLQAQNARAPYVGLWTRLQGFQRDDLARCLEQREVVKATFVRATLHVLTADDYRRFRATVQPVLTSALEAIVKERGASVDISRLVEAAREHLLQEPLSFADITSLFKQLEPDGDPGAMRYAVRTHLPLVQVPTSTRWSFPGNPRFTLAETWLEHKLPTAVHLPTLVERYLAAFGPASVKDMETWSYLGDLKPVFERLELHRYRDERGRELFDLPALGLEAEDAPAPVRFLPEFDNLLLAHQDRTRVVRQPHRKRVFLPGLRVAATVLIDGFVAGTWSSERAKQHARLIVYPFEALAQRTRRHVIEEGERLLRFVEPEATTFEVRFAS